MISVSGGFADKSDRADGDEKKNILIISGDPRVLAEVKKGLAGHYDVSIAATGATALASLKRRKPSRTSAVIVCIGEDCGSAFEVYAGISHIAESERVPVIFLADSDDESDEAAAFAAGAADYTVRRRDGFETLIERIDLRVRAGENEMLLSGGESGELLRSAGSAPVKPEDVLAGKTILVADDIELNRDIIAGMLSGIDGLTVEVASDGKEAVEKFAESPARYAFILMDIQMPVMDGLEATRAIRGLGCENSREIPVIAMTAGAKEYEASRCFEAGMNAFIEKPVGYEKLLGIAAEYCRKPV